MEKENIINDKIAKMSEETIWDFRTINAAYKAFEKNKGIRKSIWFRDFNPFMIFDMVNRDIIKTEE